MNSILKPISFSEAKAIAERQAFSDLQSFGAKPLHALKNNPLEAEYCWMFFRNDEIDVPPEATLGIKWAYVVSKRGAFSMVQDFSDDPEKLQDYLRTMSEYFRKRGE